MQQALELLVAHIVRYLLRQSEVTMGALEQPVLGFCVG